MNAPVSFEVDIDGQIGGGQIRVAPTRPAGLEQHLSNAEWTSFCNKFNQALKAGDAALDALCAYKVISAIIFVGCLIGVVASIVTRNNKKPPSDCFVDDWNNGIIYTTEGTSVPYYSNPVPCNDEDVPLLGGGQIACIVLMVVFAVLLGLAVVTLQNQSAEASLEACRRVCEEFSNIKTNMSVRLRTKATGAMYHHHDDHHGSRDRPFLGAIYYVEFEFSEVGSRPPAFAPSSANEMIPMATEVDVEVGVSDAIVVPTSSSVAMIPLAEVEPAYATAPVASAPPLHDENRTSEKAFPTAVERLRTLESIKDQLTEDDYKEKRKEILSQL